MGYETSIDGELIIEPPLPYAQFARSPFYDRANEFAQRDPAVRFEVEEYNEETDRGLLVVRQAVAIRPISYDPYRAYTIMEDLEDLLRTIPPGTTVSGYLLGKGDDYDDLWRIYVKDSKPVKIQAQLHWHLGTVGLPDEIQVSDRGRD